MQIAFLSCCLLTIFAISVAGQSGDTDPYSVNVVRNALNERTGEQKVIHSWSQKHLSRLGDGVSVALIKILEEGELVDPHTVSAFLPIIRDSFAEPAFIEREDNRRPKVTVVLLRYLSQNVSDAQAELDIQHTQEYVKQKTRDDPEKRR